MRRDASGSTATANADLDQGEPARERGHDGERGSALVEMLGGSIVILVPLVYLVLTLVQVQGATFAATGAARDVGRIIATADQDSWTQLGIGVVELAFADQGIEVDGASALSVTCSQRCQPGDRVLIQIATPVALPFAPTGIGYTSTAQTWVTIDPYRERE